MDPAEHWHGHAYPVQSSRRDPVDQEPPEDNTDPVRLPRNISSLKDSGSQHHQSRRTIVLCLDGTGDKFDDDNSNIVHLVSCLKKDDKSQVTYYQAGIGTYSSNGLQSGLAAAMDMAVGSGLGLHVRDAYDFLIHAYKEGDKICIFGFSRGAYTARCLAGMVHKVGLLPPRNIAQIPFAYDTYKDDTPAGWKRSADFKKTFCIDAQIYFLGVFDSVSSVGFIPRQLPLSSTPWSKPRYFRHAMALDERRSKFKICRHQTKAWEEVEGLAQDLKDQEAETEQASKPPASPSDGMRHLLPPKDEATDDQSISDASTISPSASGHQREAHDAVETLKSKYEREVGHVHSHDTDVLEVWFAGCHADVGGGAVHNDSRHKLSHIPLRWMIRQTFECDTGIIFNTKALVEVGLDVHMLWPKYRALETPTLGPPPSLLEQYREGLPPISRRSSKLVLSDPDDKAEGFYDLKIAPEDDDDDGEAKKGEWVPEQMENYFDAMAPMNDQLSQAWGWWILEVWPVEYKIHHEASDEWRKKIGMNLGRYRAIEDTEPNLHWTVRQRMHDMGYKIQARTGSQTYWRIVA